MKRAVMQPRSTVQSVLLTGSVLSAVTMATVPAHAAYELVSAIPIPATLANPFNSPPSTPNGPFTTYDISFFDPTTQLDYVADRTNGVVDVFSAKTNTFVGTVGSFQGIQPPPPAAPNNAISGPDGVVVVSGAVGLPNEHQLWVGDGNSTLAGFSLPSNNPITGTPISTVLPGFTAADTKRVDEGSFDPKDNVLVFANNAASPTPYITVINAANNQILKQNVFDGKNGAPDTTTNGGIEQPAWDKVTQSFYLSVDTANGIGGIAKLDSGGNVTKFYDLSASNFLGAGGKCNPTGLAVSNIGGGTQLTLACAGQSLIFDPSANGGTGQILKEIPQVQGGDEVWFDPNLGYSYLTGLDPTGTTRLLGIVDLNNLANIRLIQTLNTGPGAHSVAVDAVTGEAFVPVGGFVSPSWGTAPGSAAACGSAIGNKGCVLVFALVPEPSSLPVLITGLAGLFALGLRRAWRA
jgi:hypothetical protein